jgi:hypothetical protein
MGPHIQRLQEEIAAAVAGMSVEQMKRHPPGKWCAAEVLEHLYLTYTGTTKGFERVVQAGKPLASPVSFKQRVGAVMVLGFGYMPTGRESPATVRPRGVPQEKVLADIGPAIAAMDEIIARCEEKIGRGEKLLDHPILGPLTGAQWRKFHLVHGLHHVKQIGKLREQA